MEEAGRDVVVDLDVGSDEGPLRLMLHVPLGTAPADGWPVLYLVDGNAVYATARDALRAQAPYPAATGLGYGVVAAVGYPVEGAYDPLRRSWDLSPPPGRTYPPFSGTSQVVRTGGAESLLDAIARVVKPHVARQVPVDPGRQALFGHSFGGLFALYALYTRPSLFDTYVAASPTLYWEDGAILPFERAFSPPDDGRRRRVLLSAGEWEGDTLAPFQRAAPDATERAAERRLSRTIDLARTLAARLMAEHGAKLEAGYETFADETHMSVLPVAVARAVRAAFELRAADGI